MVESLCAGPPWCRRLFAQHKPVSGQNTPKRRGGHPHRAHIATAIGELAVRPADRSPLLGDSEDLRDFAGRHRMHRRAARSEVAERAQLAPAGPPAMHPVVADLRYTGGPCVPEPGRDRAADGVADLLFDLGGDSRGDRPVQSQPDFPPTIANSTAWTLTASVSRPISAGPQGCGAIPEASRGLNLQAFVTRYSESPLESPAATASTMCGGRSRAGWSCSLAVPARSLAKSDSTE